VNPTVSNDLRRIRSDRGLSQAELAARVQVSRQTVNSIETGKYTPATELSLRLAAVLDCRVEDIFRLVDTAVEVDLGPAGRFAKGDRLVLGHVGKRTVGHRLAGTRLAPDAFAAANAHATDDGASLLVSERQLSRTVLLAGCDPSLSILAEFVARKSPDHRVVPLHSPSEAALRELEDGLVHVAGSHLPGAKGVGQNVKHARKALSRRGGLVVTYASWEQGIVLQHGNPRRIRSVADLAQPNIRLVNRDSGSGSRRLLDEALVDAGIEPTEIAGYDTEVATHMAVARSVASGVADAGIALRAVANAFDLGFVPLAELRFDLTIPAEHLEHETVRLMLEVLQSKSLRAELAALPGYEVSRTGSTLLELKAA
jgi:molybdate-binding protein/DNA-binding XRE family transcriptional regulator